MDVMNRIDAASAANSARARAVDAPPPARGGGAARCSPAARIRPLRLCIAVAGLRRRRPGTSDAAAAAIEPVALRARWSTTTCPASTTRHCGAARRRYAAYGERLAVLAGDALIVPAVRSAAPASSLLAACPPMLATVARGSVGMPHGIVRTGLECGVAGRAERLPAGQDRCPVRGGRQAGAEAAGSAGRALACVWASVWARPTRWPTTSATSCRSAAARQADRPRRGPGRPVRPARGLAAAVRLPGSRRRGGGGDPRAPLASANCRPLVRSESDGWCPTPCART